MKQTVLLLLSGFSPQFETKACFSLFELMVSAACVLVFLRDQTAFSYFSIETCNFFMARWCQTLAVVSVISSAEAISPNVIPDQ